MRLHALALLASATALSTPTAQLSRAATFWRYATPVVAKYLGQLASIELQERLSALTRLPLQQVAGGEDIQLVHYSQGAAFGMHHDSSAFLPRLLTAFYYLNEVEGGGETAFPAADGAMSPDEALALAEPAAAGGGLVVKPARGAALLWYNHGEDGSRDACAVHAGCRVTAGEKWGANHWVRVRGATPGEEPSS